MTKNVKLREHVLTALYPTDLMELRGMCSAQSKDHLPCMLRGDRKHAPLTLKFSSTNGSVWYRLLHVAQVRWVPCGAHITAEMEILIWSQCRLAISALFRKPQIESENLTIT